MQVELLPVVKNHERRKRNERLAKLNQARKPSLVSRLLGLMGSAS